MLLGDDADGEIDERSQVSVEFGPWIAHRGKFKELGREYNFKNLGGPGTTTQIDLRCRLIIKEQEAGGFFRSQVRRTATPFIYLVVDPYMLEQTKFVSAIFAPSDDLISYEVLVAKVEVAATGVNFVVFDESNGGHLVSILKLGRRVTVRLLDEAETIGLFPLENDFAFALEYEEFKSFLLQAL
jgi:hypothetical protein